MTDLETLVQLLARSEVEFIVVGGVAAIVHGSARLTQDLDVVYRRTPENLERLAAALAPYEPYLRGAPPGLPFRWDVETLRRGLNFTLSTSLGSLDLLGEITGGGGYEDLRPHSRPLQVFGVTCDCLGLDRADPCQARRRPGQGPGSHRRARIATGRKQRDIGIAGTVAALQSPSVSTSTVEFRGRETATAPKVQPPPPGPA